MLYLAVSLPSRERGLKQITIKVTRSIKIVAPFAGAWIETSRYGHVILTQKSRSLRGSVD